MAQATFGAGCFWGVEETFRRTRGVTTTAAGYMGGHTKNPTYEEVCTGTTGHAEVVHVEYDETVVSYETLLDVFFANHDPTQKDRQGPDVGTQYRSVIFPHTPKQHAQAHRALRVRAHTYAKPLATQVLPASTFYTAEDYHQQYLAKRGQSHCHF